MQAAGCVFTVYDACMVSTCHDNRECSRKTHDFCVNAGHSMCHTEKPEIPVVLPNEYVQLGSQIR
jgi:hypothetical protein